MPEMITFEEVLIDFINEEDEQLKTTGCPKHEMLRDILYFVRNIGDVMNLNLRDGDFRNIVGTFYTDMINSVMNGEELHD